MRKLFLFIYVAASFLGILLLMAYDKPKKMTFVATTDGYSADIKAKNLILKKTAEGYTLKSLVSYLKYDTSNSYFIIVMEK